MPDGQRERHAAATADMVPLPEAIPASGIARFLLPGSLVAVLLVLIVAGATLWQARLDAQRLAARSAENLLHGITGYMERSVQLYTFALDTFVDRLRQPEIAALSPGAKAHALTVIAEHLAYVDNVLVLDPAGNVVISSYPGTPISGNFADRDYFQVQRDTPDAGVYVSEPFASRLGNNDPSVAISRRLTTPDGHFAGVIAIVARLAAVQAFRPHAGCGPARRAAAAEPARRDPGPPADADRAGRHRLRPVAERELPADLCAGGGVLRRQGSDRPGHAVLHLRPRPESVADRCRRAGDGGHLR